MARRKKEPLPEGIEYFGPRWPAQEPSRANERQVRYWTATPEAKTIPNPYTVKRIEFFKQMGEEERLFWQEVRRVFGPIYYDGNDERSSEKDKRRRGI